MNSDRKGKDGERQLARFLTDRGYQARRGQQHRGGADSPDVLCPSLPFLHFESKRCERLRLHEAVQQAITDAGQGGFRRLVPKTQIAVFDRIKVPIVAHKANRRPWLAILKLSDLLAMLEARA